ncbi:uncharacterized protein JCM6883_003126 [Sporobolomyces salmoneus]|uniref:uncharacterized protein n=1 Tax=Sporobolomyces salmoneus TaxID=183962 RepID=UPI00317D3351
MPLPPANLPAKPQEELSPAALASLWKKSGQFDKLRKRLLSDFLSSPEKDQLVSDLDSLLPPLLTSLQPPISRIPRKDRPIHVLETLDKRTKGSNPIEENVERVRERLSKKGTKGSRGLGRTVERELRGCVRRYRQQGTPMEEGKIEEPDSQEEEGDENEKVANPPLPESTKSEPSAAPTTTREASNGPSISSDLVPPEGKPSTDENGEAALPSSSTTTPLSTAAATTSEDVEMKPVISEESVKTEQDVNGVKVENGGS